MKNSNQTKLAKKAVLSALEKTLGIVTQACNVANVSRSEFYLWKKQDIEFAEAVDGISEIVLDFAESSLHRQIQAGNTSATIFYLKCRGTQRGYIERQEIDLKGELEHNVIVMLPDNNRSKRIESNED